MAKKDSPFKVLGRVIDRNTKAPLAGLRVEAWDKDLIHNDLVGSCVTNDDGTFQFEFKRNYFEELFVDRRPDLFFRVFHDGIVVRTTEDSILWNVKTNSDEIVIEVASTTGQTFDVNGTVRLADGYPGRELLIAAFDRDLRTEQRLGTTRTDRDGNYHIQYSAAQFQSLEAGSADLVVKALAPGGNLLASSPILFNAPRSAKLDLTIPAEVVEPPSLFERIAFAVDPVLAGLKRNELDESDEHRDLSFLAGETGFDMASLARFAIAHRLAQKDLPPVAWFALLGDSVFQFRSDRNLNDQVRTVLDGLPNLTTNTIRKALVSSINKKEISAVFRAQIEAWAKAFQEFVAQRSVSVESTPNLLQFALDEAGITSQKKREAFARFVNQHPLLTPEIIAELQKDKSFEKSEIAELQTVFEIANLTQADNSLIKAIRSEFVVREPDQVRALARRSEDEWVELVTKKHRAGDIKLPAEVKAPDLNRSPHAEIYGRELARKFREAFPTVAFSGDLDRALKNGGTRGIKHADKLWNFLDQHGDFEFLNTNVDRFLKKSEETEAERGAGELEFRTELKSVQRVFKLATRFEAADSLLSDGIHSAQQIYRMGKSEFVQKYKEARGFDHQTARRTWNRAADTHAGALTIVGDLKALDKETVPQALKLKDYQALESFPNWDNLFRSGDVCDCEQCRSVLSPAAYFADLLMFLKDRESLKPKKMAKDILLDRRPDLGYIELNCDNAMTTLPYVDVVCEVLENVIADGENDVELQGLTTIADDAVSRTKVANALASHQLAISDNFTLSSIDPASRWVVHGDDITYLLKKNGQPNFSAEILRNTKTSSDELRAYPQYVNAKAYEQLAAARFPYTLPFDLYAEEVRAALQKSSLQRWDLMSTYRGPATENPNDVDIACEYFNISVNATAASDEKTLILISDQSVAGQKLVWGEFGSNWLLVVANVKAFLLKTGLDYNELLALLDLKFINPNAEIVIIHEDPSCDTEKKHLENLDAPALDRIHRFLRLWRKLEGWKMWELDLVIRHPSIGGNDLDEMFLINLMHFAELKKRLGSKATAEHVAALLGNLNTETNFTELYKKRSDPLYHNLFFNSRLINPLDPKFEIINGDVEPGQFIVDHRPVVLSALGIRDADLSELQALTKASDSTPYINDDLTLANLSFLHRQAWLSKLLKFKAEEWTILLKLIAQPVVAFPDLAAQQTFLEENYFIKSTSLTQAEVDELLTRIFHRDVFEFACPKSAREFVDRLDRLKQTGFSVDELSWLLAADRNAKAAVRESDVTKFLTGLRSTLQQIKETYRPEQYDFLSVPEPTDTAQLSALLTTLLQQLNRSEAEANLFQQVLKGPVVLESRVEMPAGFVFPATITGAPNHLPVSYSEPTLRFQGLMTDSQRVLLLTDPSLASVTGDSAYQVAIDELFQMSKDAPANFSSVEIDVSIPGGIKLPDELPSVPLRYNATTNKLSFVGLMSEDERQALIDAPNPSAAIEELFQAPRMAVKFYEPVFEMALQTLPASIDFKTQLGNDLAARISYDVEQRLLRFNGVMSQSERAALDALVANTLAEDIAYHAAIAGLFTQPHSNLPPADRIWLNAASLNPAPGSTLAKRLANAIMLALDYLARISIRNEVIVQASAQLGLTEAFTTRLLTDYALLPKSLLSYLTNDFILPSPVVLDSTNFKDAFAGWYWLGRVAIILNKWKINLGEWERLFAVTSAAQILDFLSLPLDDTATSAPVEPFLRLHRLVRLRDTLPETGITLFEVLAKLNSAGYTQAAFAADVELLNDVWLTGDVQALVATLDLSFPADYLLAESWDRIRRAFYFVENLNAGPALVKAFAASKMGQAEAKTLKELFRSKFGTETWLTLSAEIQNVLRERKRDALDAYLLTQPKPGNAPTDKWENTNDLYAYYLLDVEMCSCFTTSRLVQASGSVQLFVQRCLMGLEPDIEVVSEGAEADTAWLWWKWMSKYRVWEANRKVFLWPENWIEPELRTDKSQFFQDLEDELLQNDIDQYTSETAIQNYLQKLDSVAQLEIAGFFQEDIGDETIVHVVGRTKGAEPHFYYYRKFDYMLWTPWEKVDLDIESDYLIPAVVSGRLFLFWPIFKEVADEPAGKTTTVNIPKASLSNDRSAEVDKPKKRLTMNMAVSDYRNGKWSSKRVSKDIATSNDFFVGEIVRNRYRFFPTDHSDIGGSFFITFSGFSTDTSENPVAQLEGAFEIAGCTGAPVLINPQDTFLPALRPEIPAAGEPTDFMKWAELASRSDNDNDFTLLTRLVGGTFSNEVFKETPGLFKMATAWHLSYFDKLFTKGSVAYEFGHSIGTMGTWLPWFYNDKPRTFFVLPATPQSQNKQTGNFVPHVYYPELKKWFRYVEGLLEQEVRKSAEQIVASLSANEKVGLSAYLQSNLHITTQPPYTDEQLVDFLARFFMSFFYLYLGQGASFLFLLRQFHFKNFYHPFVCEFARLVFNPLEGIPSMMSRETQLLDSGFKFKQEYDPTGIVIDPGTEKFYPKEVVDFTPDGAYSPYNWELFFHVPLLIANSLSRNQRFEEARDWYHFIFNPIGIESSSPGGSTMSKYWITKPFFEATNGDYLKQRIDNIMLLLAGSEAPGFPTDPAMLDEAKKALEKQVLDWRIHPFEPHRIAMYRTVAYQKTTVMKYLDNLIAWGDYLFRQDSMESINEATQLYVMAQEILGPKPQKVPPQKKPPLETFNELENEFDDFSNALVEVENLIPAQPGNDPGPDPAPLPTLYFCIPQNEKLLSYWDTVADRLYKIRHCMNIEGVVRQLSLFEPPIDPAALVKAVAGGMDISSALADLNAPLPLYRFTSLLQRAKEVCNDVRSLGSALLTALEKKDAEDLALLRQTHEQDLLSAVKLVREKQIEEAKENLEALKRTKATTEVKRDYYRDIEKIISAEQLNLDQLEIAQRHSSSAQDINIGASMLGYIPNVTIGGSGFGGSPHVNAQWGTGNIISALQGAAGAESQLASLATYQANRASTSASHERRFADWKLQESLAEREIAQIEKQIAGAELRITIAEQELENNNLQIENSKATYEFMRSKYTNKELYQWQISQISGVYFQSYKLAYDLAKRAERNFRFELGLQDSSYINFGYWDSLKKGLMSGEKLQYDLHRLENAYLEQNRREFELTKHVSMAMLNPLALMKLRETGRCFFRLPEEIFDLDFPGHYFRRIKSVGVTLPCVVGPYTTISCTLRLLKNNIRINTTNGDNGYPHNTDDLGLPVDDTRFIENAVSVKAIAASSSQNDSGVFELNFRDERYLPFEGAGVISEWSFELFNDLPSNDPDFGKSLRQFDYETISEVVVHIKYTAREDAGPFKTGTIKHLREYFEKDGTTPSLRLFNLRQEFPGQWHRFLNPTNPANGNVFEFSMSPSLFSLKDAGKTLKINTVWLLARCSNAGNYAVAVNLSPLPVSVDVMTLAKVSQYGGLHFSQKDVSDLDLQITPAGPSLNWALTMSRSGGNLQPDPTTNEMEVADLILVVGYEWEPA